MRRQPDPDQTLFKWVWNDPDDDRPDNPEPNSPPLRDRVRQRHSPRTLNLWGVPITLGKPQG